MKLDDLWNELSPDQDRLQIIEQDLADGKVPELPFFIIDEKDVKECLKDQLEKIDGNSMQVSVISADYGNGKTNLLKYLQMFFRGNKEVSLLYTVADDEQSNIYLQLLQLVQKRLMEILLNSIKKVQNNTEEWDKFFSPVKEIFVDITDYINNLLSVKDESKLKELIYLGTGRLYSKVSFNKLKVEYFGNIERRLVLGFFLNMLSFNHHYVIFAIDELEKIAERSKIRLNRYLTTFREMYDISSSIHGHFIMSCMTNSINIAEINPPFNDRIEKYKYQLTPITEKKDINELISALNNLVLQRKTNDELAKISSLLIREKCANNRILLQKASEYLKNSVGNLSIEQLLKAKASENLINTFKVHKEEVKAEVLKNNRISNVIFDTLEYYLISYNALSGNSKLDKRDLKMFYDSTNNTAILFLFSNNDLNSLGDKLKRISEVYQPKEYVIFAPDESDISKGRILETGISIGEDIQVEYYMPEDLATLLDLYREDVEFRSQISNIIHMFTKNLL